MRNSDKVRVSECLQLSIITDNYVELRNCIVSLVRIEQKFYITLITGNNISKSINSFVEKEAEMIEDNIISFEIEKEEIIRLIKENYGNEKIVVNDVIIKELGTCRMIISDDSGKQQRIMSDFFDGSCYNVPFLNNENRE